MQRDPKIVPVSRIPYATHESRDRTRRVIQELEREMVISPEWTSTGRGYLTVQEWEIVQSRLSGCSHHPAT